ncbi:MAG: HU family DNA-binding protein [Thermoanaerobacterales bacterium]|nr:HU family DNA-binding protein [Thermoanaerobacterales bacterium]
MTKAELIKVAAEKSGLSQKQAGQVLDAVLETVAEALAKGDEVRLSGFGVFAPVARAARAGRNPRTGEEISIPARVVPVFRTGKELKAAAGRA